MGDPENVLHRATDGRVGGVRLEEAHLPAAVLCALLVAAFVAQIALTFIGEGPERWALSWPQLRARRYETLFTHMFAHGGLLHLAGNLSALLALAPPVALRLGTTLAGYGRFFILYLASGLAGGIAYLALRPAEEIGMVGASGAICGLWGAFARTAGRGEAAVAAVFSAQVLRQTVAFAVSNLVLIALSLAITGGLTGHPAVRIAWEGHLGGYMCGLAMVGLLARKIETKTLV
ncbi:MAG TPA: rhomboid family intramembrane serine protease [Phenylobacterium sp.]|nr:rhomboid family intramembrane serine protease [Phenylobacterium sp.]